MDILSILPSRSNDQCLLWKYEDRQDLYEKYTQYTDENVTKNNTEMIHVSSFKKSDFIVEQHKKKEQETTEETHSKTEISVKSKKNNKRDSPMTIVVKITDNIEINSEYMRNKLIQFISKKEFQKFFGVKKTADVMKGLTENKWNKSVALFMSFIFDISFIYLNKPVKYNSEKEYDHQFTI